MKYVALVYYNESAMSKVSQAASKTPPIRYGSIEIRPVRELQQESNAGYQLPDSVAAQS